MLSSTGVPNVWGQAIKNQMDTLLCMIQERQGGHVDRACLNEPKFPVLTKTWDERSLTKPLHIGTVWPTLVNGMLELVVPDGGRCCVCDASLSNNVAQYVGLGDDEPLGVTVVTESLKGSMTCDSYFCKVIAS